MREEADIYEQLHDLMHAFSAQMRGAVADDLDGLSAMASRVLAYLARRPGSTPSEMVEYSGRDKAQIARIIKQLEEERYVTRAPDPRDGRSYTLTLSERGRAVHKKMEAHRRRVLQAMLRGVSDGERAQLSALLHRLHDNLDERAPRAG